MMHNGCLDLSCEGRNAVSFLDLQKRLSYFRQFWEKAPGQNREKMIDLTAELGEINDIEHYKGRKIYHLIQVILDCIMSTIPLKHKCLSIILIWVMVSHK